MAWAIKKPLLVVLSQGGVLLLMVGTCFLLFTQGGWVPLTPAAIALLLSAVGTLMLDRANQGGYTQAVYEQVKEKVQVVLNPTIEIDQAKRQREVEAITQESYFQDLASRAKAIRERRGKKEEGEQRSDGAGEG